MVIHIFPHTILQCYTSNKNRACIRLTDGAEECAGVLLQFSNEVAHLSFHRFIQCLGVDCGLISEKQRLSQQSSVPDTHTHAHTVLEDNVMVNKLNTLMQMCEITSESKSVSPFER